jgi:hypothetical protein
MLPRSLVKGFSRSRLRNLLLVFFVLLAVPTGVLIWQAYGQLKWEAFHQYRGDAEELTRRIDTQLGNMVDVADSYAFTDYSFLVVTGDPNASFVQRSQLSAYPVTEGPSSIVGHFQVDTSGAFSTPLLPPTGTAVSDLGISDSELYARQQLATRIQDILSNNALVRAQADGGLARPGVRVATPPETERVMRTGLSTSAAPESMDEKEEEARTKPASPLPIISTSRWKRKVRRSSVDLLKNKALAGKPIMRTRHQAEANARNKAPCPSLLRRPRRNRSRTWPQPRVFASTRSRARSIRSSSACSTAATSFFIAKCGAMASATSRVSL